MGPPLTTDSIHDILVTVDYGIWLELAHEKRFAILEEAIEQNKDELIEAYKRLVGG